MAEKPTLDFTPGNMDATGGLIGNWSITYPDGTGLTAGQQAVLDDAKKRGFRGNDIAWTEAARKEAWRAFRLRYGRGRGRR